MAPGGVEGLGLASDSAGGAFAAGHFYGANLAFGNAYPIAYEEPCGLTPKACCALAYDHNHTAAWHLSPSGCCTLLEVPEADHAGLKAGSTAPTTNGQTTRPVVEWSGARKALISEFVTG